MHTLAIGLSLKKESNHNYSLSQMEQSFDQNQGNSNHSRGNRGNQRRPWHPRTRFHPGPDPRRNFSNYSQNNDNHPDYQPATMGENPNQSGLAAGSVLNPSARHWYPSDHPAHREGQGSYAGRGQTAPYMGRGHQTRISESGQSSNWRERELPNIQASVSTVYGYQHQQPFAALPPELPPQQNFPRQRGSGRPRYYKNFGRDRSGRGSRGFYDPPQHARNESHDRRNNLEKPASMHGDPAEEPTGEDGPADEVSSNLANDLKIGELSGLEKHGRTANSKKLDNLLAEDDGTQRDQLTEDLIHGSYECMVCCERIRPTHDVWSCHNCYHIFHLWCIRKWVQSSKAVGTEEGWRCPGCQNVTERFLNVCLCFCGKMRNPEWNRHDTPHSCGEQCGKKRQQHNCVHPCNILCHPGPCPPCGIYVNRSCSCGKETQKVRCAQTKSFSCGQTCEKLLNCGSHVCQLNCHTNSCDPCSVLLQRTCFCGKQMEEVVCTKETAASTQFSCNSKCGKELDCKNHSCEMACHAGKCGDCQLAPDIVTHCPCGKTALAAILKPDQMRKVCTDPIPVCDEVCNKLLDCGPEDEHHVCKQTCHSGACPPCTLESTRKCRCGHLRKDIPCCEITSNLVITCKKRCNKKKHCGRHKCSQTCCTDVMHRCTLVCGLKLSCGLHQCDEPCHLGNCPTCWNSSFQELTCHCGAAILYPPIPCGTRPPECNKPCTRRHICEHPIKHNCHSEVNCPPCTSLTSKWCYGNHELRTCIPCYQTDVCCGLPCNKMLPCGQHKCIQTCHKDTCISEGFKCQQPCTNPRPCGHSCGVPCHEGECPLQTCKTMVSVTCRCGCRSGTMSCADSIQAYQRLMSSLLASKHHTTDQGQTLDITDVVKDGGLKKNCTLDCNDDCSLIERNRRLALALQIRNPELTCKLKPPVYSDFLKDQMRQNGAFVTSIYNKLTELVQSAKQSKQKSRSHAFPTMKNDHRHVIHELAEFFGCETVSYDEEPKKNVVATAFRDKSWLPSTSIMAVIQKELGATRQAGKAPPPVPHHSHANAAAQARSNSTTSITALVGSNSHSKPESAPPIDYFDYTD